MFACLVNRFPFIAAVAAIASNQIGLNAGAMNQEN